MTASRGRQRRPAVPGQAASGTERIFASGFDAFRLRRRRALAQKKLIPLQPRLPSTPASSRPAPVPNDARGPAQPSRNNGLASLPQEMEYISGEIRSVAGNVLGGASALRYVGKAGNGIQSIIPAHVADYHGLPRLPLTPSQALKTYNTLCGRLEPGEHGHFTYIAFTSRRSGLSSQVMPILIAEREAIHGDWKDLFDEFDILLGTEFSQYLQPDLAAPPSSWNLSKDRLEAQFQPTASSVASSLVTSYNVPVDVQEPFVSRATPSTPWQDRLPGIAGYADLPAFDVVSTITSSTQQSAIPQSVFSAASGLQSSAPSTIWSHQSDQSSLSALNSPTPSSKPSRLGDIAPQPTWLDSYPFMSMGDQFGHGHPASQQPRAAEQSRQPAALQRTPSARSADMPPPPTTPMTTPPSRVPMQTQKWSFVGDPSLLQPPPRHGHRRPPRPGLPHHTAPGELPRQKHPTPDTSSLGFSADCFTPREGSLFNFQPNLLGDADAIMDIAPPRNFPLLVNAAWDPALLGDPLNFNTPLVTQYQSDLLGADTLLPDPPWARPFP